MILDTTTNRTVAEHSWHQYDAEGDSPDRSPPISNIDGVFRHRGRELLASLEHFGLEGSSALRVLPFPLRWRGEPITARIAVQKDLTTATAHHVIELRSARRGRKVVGELEAPLDETTWLMGLNLRGYLMSPGSPHLVVVADVLRRGWEGPPHVASFELFGAALEQGWTRSPE